MTNEIFETKSFRMDSALKAALISMPVDAYKQLRNILLGVDAVVSGLQEANEEKGTEIKRLNNMILGYAQNTIKREVDIERLEKNFAASCLRHEQAESEAKSLGKLVQWGRIFEVRDCSGFGDPREFTVDNVHALCRKETLENCKAGDRSTKKCKLFKFKLIGPILEE